MTREADKNKQLEESYDAIILGERLLKAEDMQSYVEGTCWSSFIRHTVGFTVQNVSHRY